MKKAPQQTVPLEKTTARKAANATGCAAPGWSQSCAVGGKSGAEFAKGMIRLSGFFNFARADARGADFDTLARARNQGANGLQIRIPAAAPGIVGMADHVAVARTLAAVFTLHCHNSSYLAQGL